MKKYLIISCILAGLLLFGFTLVHPFGEEEADFSIAIIPDTQFYTAEEQGGKKEMFYAQTDWILKNREKENIKYVIHLGDISNHGDADPVAWEYAAKAMYALEKPLPGLPQGLPYGMTVGNHDQSPNQHPVTGTSKYFNQYFGIKHFTGKPWYGGHYKDDNDCHFDTLNAGGIKFLFVYLEYDMFDEDTEGMNDWAESIIQKYPDRKAVVICHAVIGNNRKAGTNEQAFPEFSIQAQRFFDRLKHLPNLFMLLGGHVGGVGEGYRQDGYAGNIIRSMLTDYQGRENGGHGLMRLLTFSPKNDRITARTFSPFTGEEETDGDSKFSCPLFINTNSGRYFDFNNDGKTDLLSFNAGNWNGKGVSTTFGKAGDIPVPADYNGDGQSDIAVYRPSNGTFYISGRDSVKLGQEGDIPVPADYDGDGFADLAVFRVNTYIFADGTKYRLANGIPVPGDYDGNGKADLAVYRPDDLRFWQVRMIGNITTPGSITGEVIPVPADYDGDGKTDAAIFRPEVGEWLVLKPYSKPVKFGQAGDIPVPGNYVNGRKASPAVIRNGRLIVFNENAPSGVTLTKGEIVSLLPSVRATLTNKMILPAPRKDREGDK